MMASFFKSAKSKMKLTFQGHSKSKAGKANASASARDEPPMNLRPSSPGPKEIHSSPGTPLARVFSGTETNAGADRNAYSEASINLASYSSVDEFNLAAMKAQRDSEARSSRPPGVNVFNSHTDKTYVDSPGREVRPGGDSTTAGSVEEKPTLDNFGTVLDKGCFNVAVVGQRGSGKSALINALCGLNDTDRGASPVSEFGHPHFIPQSVQRVVDQRYLDFVFYDIPAGEAMETEAAAQELVSKLKPFECIMVVSADKFLDVDGTIARACAVDLKKPCIFVRNKADLAAISEAEASSLSMKEAGQKLRQSVNDAFQASVVKATGDGGSSTALPSLYIVSAKFHSKVARTYHLANSNTYRIDKSLTRMDEDVLQARLKELYESFQRKKQGVRPIRSRASPQRNSQTGQGGDFWQYRDASPAHQFEGYGRWQPDPGLQEAKKLSSIPEASARNNSANASSTATSSGNAPSIAEDQASQQLQDSSSKVVVKAGSEVKMPINKTVKSISLSVSQDQATLEIFY